MRYSLRATNKESSIIRNKDDKEDYDKDTNSKETTNKEIEKVPLKAKATLRVYKNA
jgi:hypothetical protein